MKEAARRFEYLDWLRGVAAVAVLVYHARLLLFQDGGGGGGRSLLAQLFYFVTGFGHLAVVVFFVLSGCVIAHVVLPRLEEERWSWREYLIARVARFWAVLIPGLLLTLFWDRLAWALFPASPTHVSARFANLLTPADIQHLGPIDFIGNLLSLQTILVPCYGSNGALWSLACEFWYYLCFPLLAIAFLPGKKSWLFRIMALALAAAVLWAIGGETARLFPVWLMGVAAYMAARRFPLQNERARRFGAVLSLVVSAGVISFVRVRATAHPMAWSDYWVGSCVAVSIFFLLVQRPPTLVTLPRMLQVIAGFSFTLYVAHTPLLAFIASQVMNDRLERWSFTPSHVALYGVIVLAVMAYAWLLAAMSEAKTDRLRNAMGRIVGIEKRARGPESPAAVRSVRL